MNSISIRHQQHNTLNVYRTLPPHCILYEVTDRHSLPFIDPGEIVVIDTEDRTARVGDIYVIEWQGGRRKLCQARHSQWNHGDELCWFVGSMRTTSRKEFETWLAKARTSWAKGQIPTLVAGWSEGPYETDHLESKLVGAVIGVYKPTNGAR
jgi:hypothetical protein